MHHKKEIKTIRAYFPFLFSEKIDPRHVFSVGEQVQAEYLFAFHARTVLKSGFEGVFSDITFDEANHTVTIRVKYHSVEGDEHNVSFRAICEGLKSSLQGTRHAPYASILRDFRCDETQNRIEIVFTKIPLNLRFLFTIPDLCIFDPTELPLSIDNAGTSTGPYTMESVSNSAVQLKLNPNYPASLRSNNIERAELLNYSPPKTHEFIQQMKPELHHSAYFYGHALEVTDLDLLKEKGYTVEIFPTEWFVFLTVKKQVNAPLKKALLQAMDKYRTEMASKASLGIPAYSISPSDSDFAISAAEYRDAVGPQHEVFDHNTKFTVTTTKSWAEIPFYMRTLNFLKQQFPNMQVQVLERKDGFRLFAKETDVALALLGISPTDPLTHISFLESTLYGFNELTSKEQLSQLAIKTNAEEFNKGIKEMEVRANQTGLIVPIAHFPGVIAYRKDFVRDETKALGWGIQTWSFKIKGH